MKMNINNPERIFRIVAGGILSSMAFWGPKKSWMLAFLVPVAEGAIGKCALYSALGINTCHKGKASNEMNNDYLAPSSPSEAAAGHPFVGVS